MICNECGMKNREGNSFCTNCGCALQLSSIQEISSTGNVKVFKTPVYKKWWFWLAIALNVLVIASIWYGHAYGDVITYYNGKNELYYTSSVTRDEAKKLGSYLTRQEFFIDDGNERSVQLDKKGSTYEFRFVVERDADKNEELSYLCKQLCTELSQNVFDGKPVEVHICDERFKTIRVIGAN